MFSGDASVPPEDQLAAASEKGIEEICFTDHVDFDNPAQNFAPADLSLRHELLEKYGGRYRQIGGSTVRFKEGAEISFAVFPECLEKTLAYLAPRSRDNARTPYQWDGTKNAGFTKGTPWLKVNPRYPEINLAKDRQDPDGIFAFYRELIRLRRTRPALFCGNLAFCDGDHPCVIAFVRTHGDDRILVLANLSGNEVSMADVQTHLPADTVWKLLLSSLPDISEDPAGMKTIAPWECAVYESAESIGS